MSKVTKVHEHYNVSHEKAKFNINLVDGEFSSGSLSLGIGSLRVSKETYSELCALIDKMRELMEE